MKKILLAFVSLILGIGLSITVSAVDVESNENPTVEEIQAYALYFMQNSQEDFAIEINEFFPMYSVENEVTGYYVTFRSGEESAGYLVLSLISGEDPVVEFSFENEGPLSEQLNPESVDMTQYTVFGAAAADLDETQIIYTGADGFYLPQPNGEYYSVVERENMVLQGEENNPVPAKIIENGILDWEDANLDTRTIYKIPHFGEGKDYWIMTQFSKGGVCAPTAATNVLWYWGKKCGRSSVMTRRADVKYAGTDRQKAKVIFSYLYTGMGTDTEGGTYRNRFIPGYEYFFGEPASGTGTWNYKYIINGSGIDEYKTALNGQCPIHLSLGLGKYVTYEGHSVFCFGYAKSNTEADYLFVMDGWRTGGKFVKFDYYDKVRGYKIYVRE